MAYIANVAVDVKHPDAKKEYSYFIPKDLVKDLRIGDVVQVPFVNSQLSGVVTDIYEDEKPAFELKTIIFKTGISIPSDLMKLAQKLSLYYGAYDIDFLKLMQPPKVKKKEIHFFTLINKDYTLSEKAANQKKILEAMIKHGTGTTKDISRWTSIPEASVQVALRALVKKGVVRKDAKRVFRKVSVQEHHISSKKTLLTQEQLNAVNDIYRNYIKGLQKPVLLYGVTGSGKTEVYLQLIEKMLHLGKRTIMLVPEISLTPQMVAIFQNRFPGKIAVLHSRLSPGERFDEWHRIAEGDADIIIGARSAIFAPVKDLGLIIIDEEHEASYKQVEYPYYDARTVARFRTEQNKALLVMGSATPSVESYYNVVQKSYMLVKLTKRATGKPMPQIELIDMREELKTGNQRIFSEKLVEAMKQELEAERQVILFLNRRGHSTFVICRECGFTLKCPHCDISLTYHFKSKSVKCHYCGYQLPAPDLCPKCGSEKIRYFGTGTEKVEQEVKYIFPEIKTLRIDADSTTRKGALENMIFSFREGKAQVLIGTQSIAKGLDFPRVSLVGIISADTALNMPDFRAAERTFQLVTQVAGRAGRGEFLGKVFIQTYCPESFAIKSASLGRIGDFYREEINNRYKAFYPPFCHILNINLQGADLNLIQQESAKIKELLEQNRSTGLQILGPVPAPRPFIRDNYRYHILLKTKNTGTLVEIESLLKEQRINKKIKMSWDMDPQDLL